VAQGKAAQEEKVNAIFRPLPGQVRARCGERWDIRVSSIQENNFGMDKRIFESGHTKQTHGVCVLLSYATAAYPYTRITASDYMNGYCQEHGREPSDSPQAERLVADYFDPDRRAANVETGYAYLRRLHSTFRQPAFDTTRQKCDLDPLEAENRLEALEQILRTDPKKVALLSWNTENGEHPHSVAIAFDEDAGHFWIADPNFQGLQGPHANLCPPTEMGTNKPLIIGDVLILTPR
jgi:hypothetical protein